MKTKNYKKTIISSKETVKDVYRRISLESSITMAKFAATYYKDEKSYVVFNYDEESDKMTATLFAGSTSRGRVIYESSGEDVWNKAVDSMKRLLHRRVIDPMAEFWFKKKKGGFVNISYNFK